jgi:hypothetical protein
VESSRQASGVKDDREQGVDGNGAESLQAERASACVHSRGSVGGIPVSGGRGVDDVPV